MTIGDTLKRLTIVNNPVVVKSARARLRWKHVLSWGTITLTITAFVCMIVYLTFTERSLTDPQQAARALLIPIVIIQAVILMFIGTGSVASSLAREREANLLDYHRMTPMSPTEKIVGFMFGLPVREYFLFALTLPFLAFAVIRGEFPLDRLAQFYIVFFSSTWLYHMTGMVAGMASARPRAAALVAQGMVVALYLVLPRLELFGFRFFEHLTILPTFIGLVIEEVGVNGAMQRGDTFWNPTRIQDVPFFDWAIPTLWFTLIVQAFLLSLMFVVVHRKWKEESLHPFSKFSGFVAYSGVMMFLIGNLWPIIRNPLHFDRLMQRIDGGFGRIPPSLPLAIMFLLFLLVSGLLCLVMVNLITPSRHTMVKGLHLSRKLGRRRVHPNSDAASSGFVTLAMIAVTTISCMALAGLAFRSGRYFQVLPPLHVCLLPLLLNAAVFLFVQGLRERFSARAFLVTVFLLWMAPFFGCMILYAARNEFLWGTWLAVPFPPMAVYLAVAEFFEHAGSADGRVMTLLPPDVNSAIGTHLPYMAWSSVLLYAGLAAAVQVELFRWKRVMRRRELREPPACASAPRRDDESDAVLPEISAAGADDAPLASAAR